MMVWECEADICYGMFCGHEDLCNPFVFFCINYQNLMNAVKGVVCEMTREIGDEIRDKRDKEIQAGYEVKRL